MLIIDKVFAANKISSIKSNNKLIKKCGKLLKTRKLFKSKTSKDKKLFKSQKLTKSR